ncbi:MAG: DUF1385 domain-containing protein [Clostridia bacterium]|nr:DUF1385 domain-containing protein [Clostridia bacterium]
MKKNRNNEIDAAQAEKIACARKTSIGGQALLEGIMMKGPKMTAMAVRDPNGSIILEKWPTQSANRPKIFKLPIIRGVYGFVESMLSGYKCLMRSAELSGLEELEEELAREKEAKKQAKKNKKKGVEAPAEEVSAEPTEVEAAEEAAEAAAEEAAPLEEAPVEEAIAAEAVAEEATAKEAPKVEAKKKDKEGSGFTTGIMIIASVLGIALAIGLFIMLPTFIYGWIEKAVPFLPIENAVLNSLCKSFFEGLFKIAILVGYMALVTLMKEIRRTFQYHGAEHKTIFCYESGLELTLENVRLQRRFHPRCGTSFLVLMLLVGMFVSFFIDPLFMLAGLYEGAGYLALRALVKLLLLPLIMGVGYELIKFAGRHDNIVTRIFSAPGLWLQRVTVLEPTDDMIECAIAAFKEVIPDDNSDKF